MKLTICEETNDFTAYTYIYNACVRLVNINQNGHYRFAMLVGSGMDLSMGLDGYKFELIKNSLDLQRPLTIHVKDGYIIKVIQEVIN